MPAIGLHDFVYWKQGHRWSCHLAIKGNRRTACSQEIPSDAIWGDKSLSCDRCGMREYVWLSQHPTGVFRSDGTYGDPSGLLNMTPPPPPEQRHRRWKT
jgi:hypothetical protein